MPASTVANGLFAIGHAGRFRTDNCNSFASFVSALSTDLNGTTAVIDVAAGGRVRQREEHVHGIQNRRPASNLGELGRIK